MFSVSGSVDSHSFGKKVPIISLIISLVGTLSSGSVTETDVRVDMMKCGVEAEGRSNYASSEHSSYEHMPSGRLPKNRLFNLYN